MHVVIFEGARWRTFAPLSLSRPVFMLATGMANLLHKQVRFLKPSRLSLWVRPELADYLRHRVVPHLEVPTTVNQPLDDEPALLVSGRTLHLRRFEPVSQEAVVLDEGDLVRWAYVSGRAGLGPNDVMERSPRWQDLLNLPQADQQSRMIDYLWDLVGWNEESLIQDYATLQTASAPKAAGPYHMIEQDQVWLGADVRLDPGVVLDASKGPVMLDRQAHISANCVLEGPCYVGPQTVVMPHSLIRPGTSVGGLCKVAGEISNSVIFACTNKAHYGYLGDSYVGKWVNLGAGTTTSNLKNTYGQITAWCGDGPRPSGRRFLGAMIGDHAKTAIGTRLMAGTYLGFCSQVALSAIAPKFVPSFRFVTDTGQEPYRPQKAVEVMKAVFARRNRTWDEIDQQITDYAAAAAPGVEAP